MMRWLALSITLSITLSLFLLASTAAQATPTIRALFVGIDQYQYSTKQVEQATFNDLRGAVADAEQIKAALRAAYGLDLDQAHADRCETSNAVSITLINRCASWQKIVDALNAQIAASKPGDTLIFYYAGHGSQIADDQAFVEASGYFSTIMPSDARNPKDPAAGDLLDDDINKLIRIANARGVIVVTIFDSCFSGAGTRGSGTGDDYQGENRGVKPLNLRPAPHALTKLKAIGPGGGYRVHFAASDQDEESREVARDGVVNGVFTTALSQALVEMPHATFGDIATATRLKVQKSGHDKQHPRAEGALQATLGGAARSVALFDVTLAGDQAQLAAGSLLGMTVGSKFALFDGDTAALADAPQPLATATITALDAYSARLTLSAPLSAPITRLRAREIKHAYAEQLLSISVDHADQPEMAGLVAALGAIPFVRIAPAAPFRLYRVERNDPPTISLAAQDGTFLSGLGDPRAAEFPQRLRAALLTLYNVQRILALPAITDEAAQISFCVANDTAYDIRDCPGTAGKQRHLRMNADVLLTVANMSPISRFLYLLVIDDRYGITMVVPTEGGEDPKIEEGRAQRPEMQFDSAGLYRFVTITSTTPIDVKSLQQAALRFSYGGECDPQIEAPGACQASSLAGRGGAAPAVGEWTITVDDATVEREGNTRP